MGLILSFAAWLFIGALMFRCLKKKSGSCMWCVGSRYTLLIGLLIVIKLLS